MGRLAAAFIASFFVLEAYSEPLLNGVAPYNKLGQEQFLAALYLPSTTSDVTSALTPGGERRLELRFTASGVSSRSLNRVWIEGMAINVAGDTLQKNADGMVDFTGMVKTRLREGDRLTIDDLPNEGITVSFNGVKLGDIRRAPDLFNMLLSTWVGSVPLSSDFRNQIMAGGNIDANLLARYQTTEPSAERIAAAKSMNAPKPAPAPVAAATAAAATVVAAAPKPTVSAPTIEAKPTPPAPKEQAIEKPKVEAPKPQVAEAAKPAPKPTQVAKASAPPVNNAFLDDEELEEEEEPLLTAASLVSRQLYFSKLLRWTYKNIRYPKRALQRGQEGSVRIAVMIDRNGKVLETQTLEDSSHSLLNTEALKAVERSDPFPPMPADVLGEKFEFTLPITFAIPKE
ncbi:TonB family protein [Simiduia agarivorans]|uniref:TonB family C-terminal domain-containing protein n=1 Tax=Simiduia agarivorans (strain DSM 21679 / JCM 13881 / BCRC 17597 / SA1) TaxID=1117647 RepID=K4KY47_SIMAS|nr:TonB family protein [Simiduia agarivorans]AFU98867.1 TonB family C-terminal domain-containing protein [Simiduia agarivorans SA1 = DSM 21679]